MSLSQVVEATGVYEQCSKQSCNERLQFLKKSLGFADVLFKFQDEEGEIKAHCCILAMTSPVFQKMLQDIEVKIGSPKVVNIVNVQKDIFNLLLSYVYGDLFEVADVQDAIQLCAAADMYLIDHLKKLCADYMVKNMTCSNVLSILDCAILIPNKLLKDQALDTLTDNAREILKLDSLNKFSMSTVKFVMEKCKIVVREIQLFSVLVDWSQTYLEHKRANGELVGKDLRWVWEANGLFQLIKFELLTPKEFGQCSFVGEILSEKESYEIICYLVGCGNKLPEFLTIDAEDFAQDLDKQHCITFAYSPGKIYRKKYRCIMNIFASCDVQLLGFSSVLEGSLIVSLTMNDEESSIVFTESSNLVCTKNQYLKLMFNKQIQYNALDPCTLSFCFESDLKYLDCEAYSFIITGRKVVKHGLHKVAADISGCAISEFFATNFHFWSVLSGYISGSTHKDQYKTEIYK